MLIFVLIKCYTKPLKNSREIWGKHRDFKNDSLVAHEATNEHTKRIVERWCGLGFEGVGINQWDFTKVPDSKGSGLQLFFVAAGRRNCPHSSWWRKGTVNQIKSQPVVFPKSGACFLRFFMLHHRDIGQPPAHRQPHNPLLERHKEQDKSPKRPVSQLTARQSIRFRINHN